MQYRECPAQLSGVLVKSTGLSRQAESRTFEAASLFMGRCVDVSLPENNLVPDVAGMPYDLKGLKEAQKRLCLSPSAYHSQVAQGILVPPVKHGRQSLVLEREIIELQKAIARGANHHERQLLVQRLVAARGRSSDC